MNSGKKKITKEEYKVNYIFDKDSKTNINEILKKSFFSHMKIHMWKKAKRSPSDRQRASRRFA